MGKWIGVGACLRAMLSWEDDGRFESPASALLHAGVGADVVAGDFGFREGGDFAGIFLGFDDEPAAIVDGCEDAENGGEIHATVTGNRKHALGDRAAKRPTFAAHALGDGGAHALEVDVGDAGGVTLGDGDGIDTGEREVARVEEQKERGHLGAQAVKFGLGLDDRAHVVVIPDAHFLAGGDGAEMFQASDEARPFGGIERAAVGGAKAEGGFACAVDAMAAFRNNGDAGTERF